MDFQDVLGKLGDLAQAGMVKGKELAQAGISKGRELAEIGKLKMANMGEQDAIRKAYSDLGKLYYAQHAADAQGDFAPLCKQIADSQEKIDFNNEKIADIKVAGGLTDDDIQDIDIDIDIPPEDNCGCDCDGEKKD